MSENPTAPTPENNENQVPVTPETGNVPAPVIPNVPEAKTQPETPVSEEPVEELETIEEPLEEPAIESESPEEQKNKPEKHRKPFSQMLVTVLAIVLGLIGVSYVFILWTIVEGTFSSAQFAQYLEMVGMTPMQLKDQFLILTHILFGGVSFVFLVAALVKFFQWIMTSASSDYKKYHLKKMGIFVFILLLLVGIWLGLVLIISRADAAPPIKQGNQERLVQTQPKNLYGLTAPASVTFDIGTQLFKKIPKELVREIQWDFDSNGTIDAGESLVTHRFLDRGENDGRYTVTLNVVYFAPNINEERTYTETVDVVISNVAISAVMTATPEVGSVPLTVKFSAEKSSDVDGSIIQYEWDLDGDGDFELRGVNKVNVENVFYAIGEHPVRLRVTGQNHDFAIDEKIITVTAEETKVRAEIVSPDSAFEGMAPLSITFDGARSFTQSGKIVKYEWRVDNEPQPFLGRTMHRTFHEPGEYQVELLVENDAGDRATTTKTIVVNTYRETVLNTLPRVDTEGLLQGIAPFEVKFDASKSIVPNAVEWNWDFDGDEVIDDRSQQVTHVFRTPGEYDVTLYIIDADENQFTKTQRVVVDKLGVLAQISATPSSGTVPLTVEFDGSGSLTTEGEIIDYVWTFPGEDPIHYNGKIAREFRQVGVFPVKLEVLTSEGKKAEKEIYISVRGQALQAAFDATPLSGEVPLKVRFSPTASTGNIQAYFWTFGDGRVSVDAYPEHTFTYAGEFPVKLKITDNRGLVSTVTRKVIVTASEEE